MKKKVSIFAIALLCGSMMLSLSGCKSGGDAEPTPTVAPTETPTDTPTPTPTPIPTPTEPPYVDYHYEYGGVTVTVPYEMSSQPVDNGDSITFEDPEGAWKMTFTPMEFREMELRSQNLQASFERNKDFGYYQNVEIEDLSDAFAEGRFKVTYLGLERNPDWVEAEMGYTTSYKEAHAFYLFDYGDIMIGPWGGMEIHIEAAENTTDPLDPILNDKRVQMLLGDLRFEEGTSEQIVSIPGVTAHIPLRWDGTAAEDEQSMWITIQGQTKGTIYYTPSIYQDPAEAAGYVGGEVKTLEYGGRSWTCAVRTSEIGGDTTRQLELFTEFTQFHALTMKLVLREYENEEDFWNYVETDQFKAVMDTLELDPDSFHNVEEEKMDATGFECNNINEISAYTGDATDLVIPAVIGENEIYGINVNLFKNNTDIVSVTISEGISYIEPDVFNGCTSLKTVVLPGSLTTIGDGAFEGCTALETVTFGGGLITIEEDAFKGCTALRDVILPESVAVIGGHAFEEAGTGEGMFECRADGTRYETCALQMARFNSVAIGPNADLSEGSILSGFAGEHIEIGEGCTELGEYFAWDPAAEDKTLQSVTLPASLQIIGHNAFYGRLGLTAIDLGQVKTLGEGAFSYTGLVDITVPGTVKDIPERCFLGCPDVMTVTLEEGVETVGYYAFCEIGRHYPEHWARYYVTDEGAAEIPDAVPNGTDPYDRAVNIYLPSTLKSTDDGAFCAIFADGIFLLWVTEPDMLPAFHVDTFSGSRVHQFYFTEEAIEAHGDELDAAIAQLTDIGEFAWYDEGTKTVWREALLE